MILRSHVFSSVRNSLRASCCVSVLAPAGLAHLDEVGEQREEDALRVEAHVLEEFRILGGENRLAEQWRDVFVPDDDAALDGEVAHELPVLAEDLGDGIGRVFVEGADLRQVVGVREEDAAQGAEQCGGDEQRRDPGVTGVPDHDLHGCLAWNAKPQYSKRLGEVCE